MGIRDALRSIRGGERKSADDDGPDVDAPEPTWFQPRQDGYYEAPVSVPARQLRFLPGGKVYETAADSDRATESDPCRGEYTGAGRFNVQRRFERLVSYAVLEMEPGPAHDQPGFLARRIDGADRSTAELHFTFHPDAD